MNDQVLQILIADDDEGDRKQIRRAIRQSGLSAVCTESASIKDAVAACDACEFDCVIIDYQLPGEDGLEGITALHGRLPYMAIIMSTGHGDETVAAEAMKRGADDYVSKSRINPFSVQLAIVNALEKCALQRKVLQQQHELENFARVLVHDLRGPASSIETYATRMGEKLQKGDLTKALQCADWVIQTSRRMNRLIETLHKYTMADAKVEFGVVDMNQVFEAATANLHSLIQESGASVTADTLAPVNGNVPQLIQLLQNLIANAIRYCDKPVACIHVSSLNRAASTGDELSCVFTVADNGIGIPKDKLKWIFEPFTRLTPGRGSNGTGLGLATCKKLIERHGGTIWCESEPASGAVFCFTLSAVERDADQVTSPAIAGESRL
jgi:signal transduction histidine kinase